MQSIAPAPVSHHNQQDMSADNDLRAQLAAAISPPAHSATHDYTDVPAAVRSRPHDQNIDPAIGGHDTMMSAGGDSGGDDSMDGRKGGKRELSQSKRAAQNRAAQRAFRQRKEGYIKKLEEQVRELHTLEDNFKAVQAENYSLREYIIHLQSRLIESQGDFPQPPPNVNLVHPHARPDQQHAPPSQQQQQPHGGDHHPHRQDAAPVAPMAPMSQLQASAARNIAAAGLSSAKHPHDDHPYDPHKRFKDDDAQAADDLKSRNLKPELLPFLPYTAPQVKRIITERLKTLAPAGATADFIPFFHPAAIELCSRKVSSQTGDLRRAFEVCRRALDLVESETRLKHENELKEQLLQMSPSRKPLGENRNLASAARGTPSLSASLAKSLQHLTITTAPRVTIAHLNKVTAAAFSNGPTQRLKTLNLQQKAALCSLMAIEKRNRAAQATTSTSTPTTPSSKARAATSAPTIKTLYEAYSTLCTQDSLLHPLSSSEFREVIGSLETLSLIAPVDGKNGSFTSSLQVGGTPGSKRGRKKKDVFGLNGSGGGLAADEKRVASCVGEREMDAAVGEGMGEGILRGILAGEGLD